MELRIHFLSRPKPARPSLPIVRKPFLYSKEPVPIFSSTPTLPPWLDISLHYVFSSYSQNSHNMDFALLHGDLDLHIMEARSLPNMDLFTERLRRCFSACNLHLPVESSTTSRSTSSQTHQTHPSSIITSDPYVTVRIVGPTSSSGSHAPTVARTLVIPNSQSPRWSQRFSVPLAHFATSIEFHVKDNDVFGAQLIGVVSVPASDVASGREIGGWFRIVGPAAKPGSELLLSMVLVPVPIPKSLPRPGVDNAYFRERNNGMVTLYQDAHVREGDLPRIELEGGRVFEHGKCWEDTCHAILGAHKLIYIAGWSIYDKVKLVREPTRPLPEGGELTLGELLKFKSKEGVRVCVLVWDDKTSHDKFGCKTGGVMQTHDEDTRKFFKHSSVICVLSPRYACNKLSIVKQKIVGTVFSHHQKCLLVDTQASGNNRKITAFLGGLDFCSGRYDTPEHRLFTDLNPVYFDDFHNPTFPGETEGPRQPWHDLHCKIEGLAAYDVLKNFEQRWLKATNFWVFRHFRRVSHLKDDSLIDVKRMSWIFTPSSTGKYDDQTLPREDDSENWHVQIFRSIDSGSVDFPKTAEDIEKQKLATRKNLVVDKSIHTAYVTAIRSAQHYIYIENQYFIGSSYGWPDYKSAEADNLIPMEVALKVASKIRSMERFAVYIIIPMWPEGSPDSVHVQEILYWQSQTMKMMYNIIGQALKSAYHEKDHCPHPQDYLNFYCLGNREGSNNNIRPSPTSDKRSAAELCRKHRRFMIYVHAKGMIVDDEYVILGSANINQRSLDGSRDTEIAMGAHQPCHTWAAKKRRPCGQVYGYRMSLWAEHLGLVNKRNIDERLKNPESLECVNLVNRVADENWTRYTAEQVVVPLEGHLLKYPMKVDANGAVMLLPGQDYFPDVGGKIFGEPKPAVPDYITM